MPTFTPGDTVPPTGLISSSPNINDDSLGTDITPVGWPTTGKVTAVEVELTATTQFTRDGQVQVGISPPGSLVSQVAGLSDAGGTFSLADGFVGGYRSGGTDAFHLDKFGGWRTDYLTFGSSGATSVRVTSTSSATPAGGWDIRAKVRCADWTDNSNRVICSRSTSFGKYYNRLYSTASAIVFGTPRGDEMYMGVPFSVPHSAFTILADGEWLWVRVTFTSGGDARMYESADGVSWSLVGTLTTPDWSDVLTTSLYFGATNQTGSGFDGDIAEVVAYDGSGTLIHDLALDAMDTQNDGSWTSVASSMSRDPAGNTATGSNVPATVRVRLDLDQPVDMGDWRLIIDAQTGTLTVDEILLELERRHYGWSVGMVRGGRG